LESIRALPQVSFRYAVDTNSERVKEIASEFDCKAISSPEEAYSDPEIDAIIVATPTGEHYGQILASLEAGKAVLTEKPLGKGIEEIDECFQLAFAKGLPLFVVFNRCFDPSHARVAKEVREVSVGQLQLLRLTSRDSRRPISYQDARMSYLLCDLAERSFLEGKPLSVPSP